MINRSGLKYIFISFLLLIHFSGSYAQQSNKKCKWISTSGSSRLDSLTVAPETIEISALDTSQWTFDPVSNSIKFNNAPGKVEVCYRTFDFALDHKEERRSAKLYDSLKVFRDHLHYQPLVEPRTELFSSPGLNKNGSISRGISFGNSQSVFVNSNLNLQLEGKLTDDIGITAVISDQNIPFQPEGNTQQIQEFDRVYINLYTNRAKLTAGDLVMKNNPSYFLRYLKNGQGAQITAMTGADSAHQGITKAGVALSKGKFHSMNVPLIEGVQGPYKLRGPNGERFLVVLANSEKVYLDGQLMQRGFNYDYIIDYNLGEITFTNNVIITKFSRVRVDFEYGDRNFNRTNINASHQQQFGKMALGFNYYGERDNRNTPINQTLTDEQKLIMSQVGDNLELAVASGVDTVDFVADQIFYKQKDTTVNSVNYQIFEQSSDPDSANLQIVFSDFGEGNGNYIKLTTTVNGTIYEWIAPDAFGNLQGRYEPVRVLTTPQKKQMFTVSGQYDFSEREYAFAEIAISDVDQNTFSALDDDDNSGIALKVGVQNKGKSFQSIKGYQWKYSADYEFNQSQFSAIDRFRDVDFERDWSADPEVVADNTLINGYFSIYKNPLNNLSYRLIRRRKGNEVNGFQHNIVAAQQLGNVALKYKLFLMNNDHSGGVSDWNRQWFEVKYQGKKFIPGVVFDQDKNEVRNTSDQVTATAMNFDRLKFYIRSTDSSATKFKFDYTYREDNDTLGGTLALRNITHQANGSLEKQLGSKNKLKLLFTYRNLEDLRIASQNEETVMGRVDWNSSFLKRHITSQLTFFSATGRELQREFIYINVPMGEGTHNWLGDLNGNGLRDIDEFVQSINSTDSNNYVKTFIPTDNFIKAFTNNLNYRLNARAPLKWRNGKGVKKFASKFSNITSWNISKKITDNDLLKRFLPFGVNISNDDLLSVREVLRSTLFYNRSNPKSGMSLAYLNSKQKNLLTGGFDSTGIRELKLTGRWNVKRKYNFKLEALQSNKGSASDFLANRTYDLITNRIRPEISFQPGTLYRISLMYSYAEKANGSGPEMANFQELGLQLRLSQVSKRIITGRLNYINIDHNQPAAFSSSALGFEMLEGLQLGMNWTWQLNIQQRLSGGLQININYEGRSSEVNRTVHIGRMQISALF